MKAMIFLLTLMATQHAFAFDKSRYVSSTLDDLISRSQKMIDEHQHTGGIELMLPPNSYTIETTLEKMPFPCDSMFLKVALKSLKYYPTDAPDDSLPAINTCIIVKSAAGVSVISFIQDSVAKYIPEELNIGDKITLYAIWLYSADEDKLPRLLTNEFSSK